MQYDHTDSVEQLVQDIVYDDFYDFKRFKDGDLDVILDIGAHIGVFTLFAAMRHTKAKIVALEPCRSTFDKLVQNCMPMCNSMIACWNAAIWKETGCAVSMTCPPFGSAHNYVDKFTGADVVSVQALRMQDLITKAVPIGSRAFLKSDCEGGESHWLFGTDAVGIINRFEQIGLEFHFYAKHGKLYSEYMPTKEEYLARFEDFRKTHDVMVDMTWTWGGPRNCGRVIMTRR